LTVKRYAFEVDWADAMAGQMRKYVLVYYPPEAPAYGPTTAPPQVEMIDVKLKRIFLKRSPCPDLKLSDLHVGALVNVFSRQLKVTDYGDEFTRTELGSKQTHTLMMIKPDAAAQAGNIIDRISNSGNLHIVNMRMVRLLRREAEEFYAEHQGKEFFAGLTDFMSSGPVIALDVVNLSGSGAVGQARELIGPTNSSDARNDAPHSLRAQFGTDGRRNAVHGSDSDASATRELQFFFQQSRGQPTAQLGSTSTLCVVKPHLSGQAGRVMQTIMENGFSVTALRSFSLDRVSAAEFYEVYKGVVPEYVGMLNELTSGVAVAFEVTGNGGQSAFRDFCGPADPEIARHLRPSTLRAKFGVNKLKNAVHCTDLPDDGPLELEYFFSVLANSGHH